MTLQEFLAGATKKAADDVKAALLRLPEDKRNWSPQGDARTALDMVAEVAILNVGVIYLLKEKKWDDTYDFSKFQQDKVEASKDWPKLEQMLDENTDKFVEAIKAVPNSDLPVEVQMPWGPMRIADILSYPYWNASYHEGQINYIASMLGCLK